jgi:hypothetical protein
MISGGRAAKTKARWSSAATYGTVGAIPGATAYKKLDFSSQVQLLREHFCFLPGHHCPTISFGQKNQQKQA